MAWYSTSVIVCSLDRLHAAQFRSTKTQTRQLYIARPTPMLLPHTPGAYLDNIPTDTFIAQSLRGTPLHDTVGILMGRSAAWTDIGRTVERLRSDLSSAFQRLPEVDRRNDFRVSILGWRIRNMKSDKPMAPIAWELRRPDGKPNGPFEVLRGTRWWAWHSGFMLDAIPDIPPNIMDSISESLRVKGRSSLEGVKDVLIAGLRDCANARPDTIGCACMQVVLNPLEAPQVKIRFVADVRHPEIAPPELVGFSPWIVTPQAVFSPALMRGNASGGWIH